MAVPPPPLIVPKKKKKRGSHHSGRRRNRSLPPPPVSYADLYESPAARERALTRKTTRRYDLKELWGNLLVPILGAGMVVLGGAGCWLTLMALRRGYIDEGESIVYASQEPFWFYFSVVFLAALALGMAALGAEVLVTAWRERRYTAGVAERLLRRRRYPE
jgi:hypothetical protein